MEEKTYTTHTPVDNRILKNRVGGVHECKCGGDMFDEENAFVQSFIHSTQSM
jgi:hypothetical protein